MKKLVAQVVSKAGAVLTLLAFFVSNVAAQSLPLADQSRSAADTIIRRLDTGALDRVAWLAKAREGLLEASASWEHKLLASGVAPGAFTAGLSAALDAAYEERLVSGFFDQVSDTVASPLAAGKRQGGISAGRHPEPALTKTGSITTTIAASANAWASGKTYEGRALTVAELGGAIGGGSYSEYRVTAHSAQAGAASAAYLSVTAVKERSQRLAEQATAMLTQKAGANLTAQADTGSQSAQAGTSENRDVLTAARGTLEGLGYWSKAEALIGIGEDTAMNPAKSSTPDNATPTMRQSWLAYNATQDALAESIAERLLRAKDAWLTQAETELSHPDAEAQFLGTDADSAVRSCLVLVVPAKDLGQVSAEHREAESHSAQGNAQRAAPASEDHPAAGNGDAPTVGINQKTEPVQKPNLLQKALQLLQGIVQSKPMDKVESSNRSAAATPQGMKPGSMLNDSIDTADSNDVDVASASSDKPDSNAIKSKTNTKDMLIDGEDRVEDVKEDVTTQQAAITEAKSSKIPPKPGEMLIDGLDTAENIQNNNFAQENTTISSYAESCQDYFERLRNEANAAGKDIVTYYYEQKKAEYAALNATGDTITPVYDVIRSYAEAETFLLVADSQGLLTAEEKQTYTVTEENTTRTAISGNTDLAAQYKNDFNEKIKEVRDTRDPSEFTRPVTFTINGVSYTRDFSADNPLVQFFMAQNDFSNTTIKNTGCTFLSDLAAAQIIANRVLTEEEILAIWNTATTKQVTCYDKNNGYKPYLASAVDITNAEVRNPNELMQQALTYMGVDNAKVLVENNDRSATYTLVAKHRRGSGHSTLADIDGTLIWDPWNPDLSISGISLTSIWIK